MKNHNFAIQQERASEKSRSGPDKGLIVFVILMFVVPFILIIAVYYSEPYYDVDGESLSDAMEAAGITVAGEKDRTADIKGPTGWKTYVLSDKNGNNATVSLQAFDSAESRDSFVRLYNSNMIGIVKPVGRLFVIGQYVVYVTPADSTLVKDLSAELEKVQSVESS